MLLNTHNLPDGYQLIAECDNLGFDNEKLFIVVSEKELLLIEKMPAWIPDVEGDEPGLYVYQTEFPRAAAAWLVDVIENKMWRSPADGGLPAGENHVKEEVAGELLKVRRTMNVGAQGQKGFALLNLFRHSLTYEDENYQEIQLTDMLLQEGGLLELLKGL